MASANAVCVIKPGQSAVKRACALVARVVVTVGGMICESLHRLAPADGISMSASTKLAEAGLCV